MTRSDLKQDGPQSNGVAHCLFFLHSNLMSDPRPPVKQPKSMYDASLGEIAVKHFFAGMMQGLGGLVVTLISWVLIYVLIINIVLPQVSGMLGQAEGLIKSVEKLNGANQDLMRGGSSGSGTSIQVPPGLLEQLQQLQKTQQ